MAYNLQSLIQVLEQTLHPQLHHLWIVVDVHFKAQLESLLQLAHSLDAILEKLPPSFYNTTAHALMSQIRDAAYRVEDIIELYMVDQILANYGSGNKKVLTGPHRCTGNILSSKIFPQLRISNCFRPRKLEEDHIESLDLPGVVLALLFGTVELENIIDQRNTRRRIPDTFCIQRPGKAVLKSELPSSSTVSAPEVVVGLENDMMQLKERLIGHGNKLEVISIVGMGGIGKTTLAQQLYYDSYVSYHFDTRTWATVSQDDTLKTLLLSLLGCITGHVSVELRKQQDDELGDRLYKSLIGKRYLVVLDDIWSTNVWDDIHIFFPNNDNGSRIILTTRQMSVAHYVKHIGLHHQMQLLDDAESWNLLRQKVFGKESCPGGLENLGKSIAGSCKGLPLAIQVIGGLLLKAQKTNAVWEHIATDVSAAVADQNDERFLKILSMSFDHLPLHLRSCFLYIGCFPEDYQIRATKIKRLLAAEGFLKPIKDKTLEEAAEEYLKALADRSLLLVRKLDYTGEVKCYVTHDLIMDMCKRKAQEEKFFNDHDKCYVTPDHVRGMFKKKAEEENFLNELVKADTNGVPVVDILREIPKTQCKRLISRIAFHSMRRFSVTQGSFYPKYRHLTDNMLQCARSFIQIAPNTQLLHTYELGEFKLLRVLIYFQWYSRSFLIQYLTWSTYATWLSDVIAFQTLSYVNAYMVADSGFVKKVPNLNKLGIYLGSLRDDVVDLSGLLELITLKLLSSFMIGHRPRLDGIIFPPFLKKLCLTSCWISGRSMSAVGSLPNLEVLNLRGCTMWRDLWEPTEGEFVSLKFLQLNEVTVMHWRADERHYPRLRRLVIRRCLYLVEIPLGFGEIQTMEVIDVDDDNPSVVASAKRIQEEQLDIGNDSLHVLVQNTLGGESDGW